MKSKIGAFGLVLTMAIALSAMAASAATAQQGHVDFGPAGGDDSGTLTVTETENLEKGVNSNALTAFGGSIVCLGSTYTGHKVLTHEQTTASAEHEPLTDGETTVTITPHYKQENSNCRTGGGLPMTITMNGCDYVFHIGVTTGEGEGTYGVTADVVCPPNKVIEVHVYGGEAHGFSVCTLKVKPQTGLHGPHLTNTGEDVDIDGTFTGIHVTEEGLCGSGTTEEGEFDIDATIEAHDEVGDPIKGQIVD